MDMKGSQAKIYSNPRRILWEWHPTVAHGLNAVALGLSAAALGLDAVALGLDAVALGLDAVALGLDAIVKGAFIHPRRSPIAPIRHP